MKKTVKDLPRVREKMNILVTIDKKYLFPLQIMLVSLGETQKEREIDIYVAHSVLDEEDFALLKTAIAPFPFLQVHSVPIREKWFSDTPVIERLPEESFYRLMAFAFLPKSVERCLYLDPDILIRKPLDKLYDLDLGKNVIAAANHTRGLVEKMNCVRLGLKKGQRYINSGVMLMDLRKIRQTLTVESVIETTKKHIRKLWMGDQDLANILFADKTLYIDELIWNLDERTVKKNRKTFTKKDIEEKAAIIHYNGKYKPWLKGYKGALNEYYPPVPGKGEKPKKKLGKQLVAIWHIVKGTKKQRLTFLFWTLVIVATIVSLALFGEVMLAVVANPDRFQRWLNGFGVFDEIVFVFLRVLQTMIKIIPSAALEVASGYAYGVIKGTALCVIGNAVGSLIEILLVKKFGRRLVEKFVSVEKLSFLKSFQENGNAYALLFFIYLLPFVPKDMLTYAVGLTSINPFWFLLLTSIARIPSILPFSLSGSALATERYTLAIVVLVVIVVLAVLGFIGYKLYLKRKKMNESY